MLRLAFYFLRNQTKHVHITASILGMQNTSMTGSSLKRGLGKHVSKFNTAPSFQWFQR